ncbi:MAG: hypothetical protein JSS20_06560 [Proteobacteria bacterium]|nr:hypothetical protein [Pseudomonadota bacterium]
MSLSRLVLIAALASLASSALAEERANLTWMSGEEIKQAFSGQPLEGVYPSQRPWSELIRQDGTTDYREGPNHWAGTWWVQDREFCFRYPPPGVGGCFRITRTSPNCYELYEFGNPPEDPDTPPERADLWNGRMWQAGKPPTCEVRPSV